MPQTPPSTVSTPHTVFFQRHLAPHRVSVLPPCGQDVFDAVAFYNVREYMDKVRTQELRDVLHIKLLTSDLFFLVIGMHIDDEVEPSNAESLLVHEICASDGFDDIVLTISVPYLTQLIADGAKHLQVFAYEHLSLASMHYFERGVPGRHLLKPEHNEKLLAEGRFLPLKERLCGTGPYAASVGRLHSSIATCTEPDSALDPRFRLLRAQERFVQATKDLAQASWIVRDESFTWDADVVRPRAVQELYEEAQDDDEFFKKHLFNTYKEVSEQPDMQLPPCILTAVGLDDENARARGPFFLEEGSTLLENPRLHGRDEEGSVRKKAKIL